MSDWKPISTAPRDGGRKERSRIGCRSPSPRRTCQITELELEELRDELARLRAASEGVIDRQFAELRFNQIRDEAADELSRLRADVERLTASLSAEVTESEKLRSIIKQQAETIEYERALNAAEFEVLDSPFKQRAEEAEAALADERRHADALAEALDSAKQHIGFNVAMLNALESHRARRQG